MAALSRLVLSGWQGSPIGDPAEPEALVYHRDGLFHDVLYVRGDADAEASRKNTIGTVIRRATGAVDEVVTEVLTW